MPAAQPVTAEYCLKKAAAALRGANAVYTHADSAAALVNVAHGWRELSWAVNNMERDRIDRERWAREVEAPAVVPDNPGKVVCVGKVETTAAAGGVLPTLLPLTT